MSLTNILSNPRFIDWLSQLIISGGVALIVATFVALGSGRVLGLAPETKLWAFIVGFAFVCSLSTAPISGSQNWSTSILLYALPLLLVFLYFLPTAAAIANSSPDFQAIFILNLVFGWTIIGWVVAVGWALRASRAPKTPGFRITPFGAVPERTPADQGPKPA